MEDISPFFGGGGAPIALFLTSDDVCPGFQSKVDPSRVPTRPGKPGKMRVHLENLEISWNFEKFNKYHGKMT